MQNQHSSKDITASITAMLICMSAVLCVPVFCMQLYIGMRNQLLPFYMDAPFLTALLFLEADLFYGN